MDLNKYIFLAITISSTTACYYKAAVPAPEPGKFKFLNDKTIVRKESEHPCSCGGDLPAQHSYVEQRWILYIHLGAATSNKRICVGTIVNSNMVITSHRCLQKKRKISVRDAIYSRGSLASVADIILSNETNLASPTNLNFTVKRIIYSERFAYDSSFDPVPETDLAILVVDFDFTLQSELSGHFPICLARYGQLPTKDLLNREAHYQGIRHWEGIQYTLGVFNFSQIALAEECNRIGRLGIKPPSNDTLCLTFTQPGPTIEGGPIRVIIKRFWEGGPLRSFLVGIASWVDKTIMNARHKYTYFENMDTMVKYIEHKATLHGSTWCPTPTPGEKHWPWERFDEGPGEGILDCECGHQEDYFGTNGRINGGEDAELLEFPWMVKFFVVFNFTDADGTFNYSTQLCGGSLINDRMILTAAHCFVRNTEVAGKESLDLEAFPGYPNAHFIYFHSIYREIVNDNDTGVLYQATAKKVVFHPGFPDEIREERVDYDIALVILDEPLALGKEPAPHLRIDPICLPKKGYLEAIIGQNVTVAGWGRTNFSDPGARPDQLKKLNVPIRPLVECAEVDREIGMGSQYPTNTRICASWLNPHQNAGEGDSGGPLMHQTAKDKFTQVGIVSYLNSGPENSNKSTTYYANVEAFLPYIYYYSKESGAKYCKERKQP